MRNFAILTLFFCFAQNSNCQNIYLLGKLPKSQENKFHECINNLHTKYKKITFYVNGTNKSFKFKYNKSSKYNSLIQKIEETEPSDIELLKNQVIDLNKNKLIYYTQLFIDAKDKINNESSNFKTILFENINKSRYNFKNETLIIYLNSNNLEFEGINFHSNMKINYPLQHLSGNINSQIQLQSIQYSLNNEIWRNVNFFEKEDNLFEFNEDIQFSRLGNNTLNLKITDSDNNIKIIKYTNIDYYIAKLNSNNCRFIFPNKYVNNIPIRKVISNSNIYFWIKIESPINPTDLTFVITDKKGQIREEIPMKGDEAFVVWCGGNTYCIGLTPGFLHYDDPCTVNPKIKESMMNIFLRDDNTNTSGESIKIKFASMTSIIEEQQNIKIAGCE